MDIPAGYSTYITRMSRWIRGDFQIIGWIKANYLNKLSKYKILDNLRRGILPICAILNLIFLGLIKIFAKSKVMTSVLAIFISIAISSLIDIINYIVFRKENIKRQKKFSKGIDGLTASIYRGIIEISNLPYKALVSLNAITKTIYRMNFSKKHLLEWTTAEEAEKQNKKDLKSMYINMIVNPVFGILGLIFLKFIEVEMVSKVLIAVVFCLWILAPLIMWYVSKPNEEKKEIEKLNKEEEEYVIKIAQNTWEYFSEFMNKENNYLPPDNFQESRREKQAYRTSSTNIGLRSFNNNVCI